MKLRHAAPGRARAVHALRSVAGFTHRRISLSADRCPVSPGLALDVAEMAAVEQQHHDDDDDDQPDQSMSATAVVAAAIAVITSPASEQQKQDNDQKKKAHGRLPRGGRYRRAA